MPMNVSTCPMIIQEIVEIVAIALLLFGIFLYFVNYRWFQQYTDLILVITALLLAAVFAIFNLLPNMIIGLVKGIAILFVLFIEVVIYLITSVVPYVGKKASPLHHYIDGKLHSAGLVDRIKIMREIVVDVIAEADERTLQFETEGEYREELQRVKQEAKTKLDRGESALSLSLGFVLILSQLSDIQLLHSSIKGISGSNLIELYLLLIATSIIYRVSILEYLTYTSEAQFNSIREFDVALSYQKGVCFTNVVQALMPVLVISFAILNVDRDLIKDVLLKKYSEDSGIMVWGPYAWNVVRNRQ